MSKTKKNKQFKNVVLTDSSPFAIQEAYKSARTNLHFTLAGVSGCKVVAVTSSAPDEGKSTTCINLAISFAQTNARVLVIDADLRKSSIHKAIGIKNESGLSNLLVGFTVINQVIQKSQYGFDVLASGPMPPNPSELLAGEVMVELIETLKSKYDYIFIDTPPVNVVADALNLSDIDGFVLTVRSGITTYDDVMQAKNKLEFAGSKILGIILNASEKYDPHSNYRKYGKYRYYRYSNYTSSHFEKK